MRYKNQGKNARKTKIKIREKPKSQEAKTKIKRMAKSKKNQKISSIKHLL